MAAGTSPIATFSKDPNAILDFTMDWRKWLGDDTILIATWTVPGGLTGVGSAFSPTSATVFLQGGTAGTAYSVFCQISTAKGRTEKRTFKINVIDR